ncbi:hypothetical protein GCM10010967_27090 [Dyadobacter beijingensis]|uniref:DinB superfamily protein n=1 Tax=Dyadobacter beijingensis TaxID=365489 RepID=A0ABQ2HXU7_9BACT|nr:DUF1572 family protein [Dyadobacter beijingensis]GGM92495.1 hypothetical protein GCM10010967_27090 [Dyadobacter beijingensis]
MINSTFVTLYSRDIKRLRGEIEQYPYEEALWLPLPGTINPGGNLCQHLIGNLRTYICLTLGGHAYSRDRDAEFSQRTHSRAQMLAELDTLRDMVITTIESLDEQKMAEEYPRNVLDMFPEQTVHLILTHLLAHLSWHLGHINYHRRWVTALPSAKP